MASVILTRPQQRTHSTDNTFTALLLEHGIKVIELPMIQIDFPKNHNDLDEALTQLSKGEFDYCVLSSPTAIEFFHDRVNKLGFYDSIKEKIDFATVGEKSAAKLTEFGYRIGVPLPHQNAGAAQLLTELRTFNIRGKKVLLLQSQIGLVVLNRAFEMCGAEIERHTLYETSGPTLRDAARLINLLEEQNGSRPNVIAFFSPSAVESFVRTIVQMSTELRKDLPALAAIGETTALEIKLLLKKEPQIVARKANQESLANDIIGYLNQNK
ncbi:MAG TPA: uroporphyrinogen-III synthase [Candidatus Kapabacteria bacterium]|nr:uroporphyrinogen-III synthase [Candidatus Kapabacteria bacterium]